MLARIRLKEEKIMTKRFELGETAKELIWKCVELGATAIRDEDDLIFEKDGVILVVSLRDDRYFAGGVCSKTDFEELLAEREEYNKKDNYFPFRLGWRVYDLKKAGSYNHDWTISEALSAFKYHLGVK